MTDEHTLTIAVLGAGNIGGTLGKKWHAAGHTVFFGVNNPYGNKAEAIKQELGSNVRIGTTDEVLQAQPDVVVIAIPGAEMDAMITKHASALNGKIIIDTANRLGGGPMNSMASFQQYTPQAHVYRAFNSLGWENFADPNFDGIQADLIFCGPEGETRPQVEHLISDVGLNPVYLGGPEQAGLVDAVGGLWFALVFGQKKSRHLAFKVLTR